MPIYVIHVAQNSLKERARIDFRIKFRTASSSQGFRTLHIERRILVFVTTVDGLSPRARGSAANVELRVSFFVMAPLLVNCACARAAKPLPASLG